MQRTHRIRELEHLRLLSDPFKLKLLQSFAEADKTTRQVADELGENVTRLYRHVDALLDAGLLRIVEETRKRGTVERTFRAIAERFEVADELFYEDDALSDAGTTALRDMLRATEDELLDAATARHLTTDDALVVRLRCRATPERIAELRRMLLDWVDAASEQDASDATEPEAAEEAAAFIAFYPLSPAAASEP